MVSHMLPDLLHSYLCCDFCISRSFIWLFYRSTVHFLILSCFLKVFLSLIYNNHLSFVWVWHMDLIMLSVNSTASCFFFLDLVVYYFVLFIALEKLFFEELKAQNEDVVQPRILYICSCQTLARRTLPIQDHFILGSWPGMVWTSQVMRIYSSYRKTSQSHSICSLPPFLLMCSERVGVVFCHLCV